MLYMQRLEHNSSRKQVLVPFFCFFVLLQVFFSVRVYAAGSGATAAAAVVGMPASLAGMSGATSVDASAGQAVQSATTGQIKGQALRTGKNKGGQKEDQKEQKTVNSFSNEEEADNDFQTYVYSSTGIYLSLFGHGLFAGGPSTFAPLDNTPVTSDYLIGPGDELMIKVWGQLEADEQVTVDRTGSIYIPKIGSVSVSGIKFQQLAQVLRSAIGKDFRNFELDVHLGHLRSIHVYVVGQARQPGSYTVSALSTLVTALFACGGPSNYGSMRAIELKRSGQVVTTFDVYDFLVRGDKSHDTHLQDGDVIYIPPVGPMVALLEGVKNPAVFELKGDNLLSDVVSLAGGLDTTTSQQSVEVQRIFEHKSRTADVWAIEDALKKTMRDGDIVDFNSLSPKVEDAVSLTGHVAHPYRMTWHEGMRVSDLIPNKEGLIEASYWQLMNQLQGKPRKKLDTNIHVAATSINWDYAVVQRFNPERLTTELVPFNLAAAVVKHDPKNDLLLQSGDVVTVFQADSIVTPAENLPKMVTIEGEINHAGVYQALPGETLRQLVQRIGGISPGAYLYGAVFTRESTLELQKNRQMEFVRRSQADISKNFTQAMARANTDNEVAALSKEEDRQMAEVAAISRLTPNGRVVLRMNPESQRVADLPDIQLENGDHLVIPAKPSTVNVFGQVYNENNSFFYASQKRVNDYLAEAGGMTRDADAGRIYLLRMDGSVLSKQNVSSFLGFSAFNRLRLMPGDTIVVPEEAASTPLFKSVIDWSQILFNMGVTAASLKVAGVL